MLRCHSLSTYAQISGFQTHRPTLYAQIFTSLWRQHIGIRNAPDPLPPFSVYVLLVNDWPLTADSKFILTTVVARHFVIRASTRIPNANLDIGSMSSVSEVFIRRVQCRRRPDVGRLGSIARPIYCFILCGFVYILFCDLNTSTPNQSDKYNA